MKTIGLIGGMSWESTVTYYRIVNTVVKNELGGFHSARCILYSVDFFEIEECQSSGRWEEAGDMLAEAAQTLEKAGADFIVICTNTMHKMADQIQSRINIPILHIAELTAEELKKHSISKVGLIGTKYTMEHDFYKAKLVENGIEVIVPEADDRELINRIIFEELCLGITEENSKRIYLEIVKKLGEQGVEGVILGCTEIGILVKQQDTEIPLFDTAFIHAERAAKRALS